MFNADTSKVIKRGRIPKGFLSSNTAYMLVYKKVNAEKRINNIKKNKLKKSDAENSSNNDAMLVEMVAVQEKSDSSDEGKRKTDSISEVSDSNNSEKVEKLDAEVKEEPETSESSSGIAAIETSVTPDSTLEEQNGKNYESDDKDNPTETNTKKTFTKNVKVDYKLLNGAAHRAMSCGERDFYEEVRIFHLLPFSFFM